MNKCSTVVKFSLPGLVLALLSFILFWFLVPHLIHSEVTQQVRLVEGTDTWNKWKEAPIPIYVSFYVQSVANPDEVESGLKPVFEEKGPYAYLQKRKKVDITLQDGENSVKYKEVKTYFFDQQHSGNNMEDDLVNIPNLPFVAVVHTIKKMVPLDLVSGIVGNVILNGESLIRRNIPVKELLFQGFDVTKYTKSILGSQLPEEFSGGRFGLFKGKNGTAGEEWQVYTGLDNPANFGRIKTWNGKYALGFWKPFSSCDQLMGSDGSVFPPFLTRQSVLWAFAPDICRSMALVYEGETEFLSIPGFRFSVPEETFEDPRTNLANRCFCMESKLEKCVHSGILPLEPCLKAPLFASAPHFLAADERYLVESGQSPADKAKHGTFIDLEPNTGMILRARKRLQFGLEIRHNRRVRALQNLTGEVLFFPFVWAEESAEVDDNLADFVKGQLVTPLKIINVAKWIFLGAGIIIFVMGACYSVLVIFKDMRGKSGKKVDFSETPPPPPSA